MKKFGVCVLIGVVCGMLDEVDDVVCVMCGDEVVVKL